MMDCRDDGQRKNVLPGPELRMQLNLLWDYEEGMGRQNVRWSKFKCVFTRFALVISYECQELVRFSRTIRILPSCRLANVWGL